MTTTVDLSDASTDVHTRRTLHEISLSVVRAKRIVVITGAGISCSCGIPDFRSSDGLYALVKEKYPDVVLKGKDLFDASLFRDSTSTAVFYTFVSELKRSIDAATPTPTHHFIKTLDSKKKLLRSYTQNIDGLEERAGLLGTSCEDAKATGKGKSGLRTKDVRNVQLHGDIHRVRCVSCAAEYPCTEEYLSMFGQGTPPDCPECISRSEARVARSARAIKVGTLRPAIVLYDEPHPLGDDIGTIQTTDVGKKPDLLIIMGTSLKVHGLKKLVKDFAKTIREHTPDTLATSSKLKPRVIFVNKTAPGSEWADIIDYHISGETDAWVAKVTEDWKKVKPADWETQQTLVAEDGDIKMSSPFKVVKGNAEANKKKRVSKKAGQIRDQNQPGAVEPPLSPSKRRQGTSHYDDIESSPSKRRTRSLQKKPSKPVLPASERKLLFGESTNIAAESLDTTTPMDISLRDLSMRDIEPEEVRVNVKVAKTRAATARKIAAVKTRTSLRAPTTAKRRTASKSALTMR